MIHPNHGDIVFVPFPFTNLSTISKPRPALVISNCFYKGNDFICFGITSNLNHLESIPFENSDLVHGKIAVTSAIMYQKIYTLHKSLITRRIAVIKADILDKAIEEFIKTVK